MSKNTALLVIDVQQGVFELGSPVYEGEALIERINHLIQQARQAECPVIFIQHSGTSTRHPLHPDNPGWAYHLAIDLRDTDIVVHKTAPDSFKKTTLKAILKDLNIKKLVIVGMQTDCCINATTRRAAQLGFDVIVIEDAHSTIDSKTMTAREIIVAHNKAFVEENIATLVSSDAATFD